MEAEAAGPSEEAAGGVDLELAPLEASSHGGGGSGSGKRT